MDFDWDGETRNFRDEVRRFLTRLVARRCVELRDD